jgi:hypothetical protein
MHDRSDRTAETSMKLPPVRVLALVAPLLAMSVIAEAIVVRHDRDEQAFIDLAKKFPATASVHRVGSDYLLDGMGTLIDPRWVLTAGHIAAELTPGDSVKFGNRSFAIEAIVQYPNWNGVKTWDDVKRDIALLRLRTAVAGVEPAKLYTGTDEAGMDVTIVGMGRHGNGLTGPTTDDGTMRAATNRVHAVEGNQIVFRFEAPEEPGVTPLEGICGDGDSGGPAYVERDGSIYIIGVGSAQDSRPVGRKLGHYGVLELYPRVSSYAGWIRSTLGQP